MVQQAGELAAPVVESLFAMKRFIAATTGSSDACLALRTISVWETEEDMVEFVVSPVHANALECRAHAAASSGRIPSAQQVICRLIACRVDRAVEGRGRRSPGG